MQKTAINLADAGFVEESKRFFLQASKGEGISVSAKSTLIGLMFEKAITFYKKALLAYPNKSEIQERLGALYIAVPDEKLINLAKGIELSERAFYNSIYTIPIKVSAARSLAIGYHKLGDTKKSRYFFEQAIELATKANLSPQYIQSLSQLAKQFGVM